MSNQFSSLCPCCQAPLPPPQNEFQITCDHCGAQIILKLPIDRSIERLAFEKYVMPFPMSSLIGMVILSALIYGWPIWLFWLRDSGYLHYPAVRYGAIALLALWCVGLPVALILIFRKMRLIAESCDWSVMRLRRMVEIQPTNLNKKMLRYIEKYVEEIKEKIDL